MINDPEALEAWYQANLAAARFCEQARKNIASQRAVRCLIDGAQRITLKRRHTVAQLLDELEDRGEAIRRQARTLKKADLIDFIIQDRLNTVDAEIARLEKLIEANKPSVLWKPRPEDEQV